MEQNIQETTIPARTYLAWRKEIGTDEITNQAMWQEAFGAVHAYAQSHNSNIKGPGTAIYFTWDEPKGRTDFAIGNVVEGITEIDDSSLSLVSILESKAIVMTVKGTYDKLMEAHIALGKYAGEKGLTAGIAFEEYITTSMDNPDPEHWETRVYWCYT